MSKSTLIAAVVFVALLAAAIVTLQEKPERGITRVSFSDIMPSRVDRVVASGKHEFELKRSDDGWTLADGRPVNAAAAERLVEALPKIESSAVVTQNPERFSELEVDEETGTKIVAYIGGDKVAAFVVGTDGQTGAHVRVGDAVYGIRAVYQSLFRRNAVAWLETKLFSGEPSATADIEVSRADGTSYTLVRQDETWDLADRSGLSGDFRFDSQLAANLERAIQNARAKNVLVDDPGDEATGLGGPVDVLTWKGEPERSITLGGTNEDGDVYARASGWDYVLTLAPHVVTTLRKSPADFRNLALMEFDPDEIVGLEIRDGETVLAFERASPEASWEIRQSTEATPEDFELDPGKVTQRVAAIGASRGTQVAPADAQTDFEAVAAEVLLTQADGETIRLRFGDEIDAEGTTGVLARGNADDLTYVAPTFARGHLTGGLASFQKSAAPAGPPQIDPAALQNLPPEVRAQLLRQMAQPQ